MAISLVSSVHAAPGANGGTTGAINTTGASLLVLGVGHYCGINSEVVVSDSKGNTWTSVSSFITTNARFRFFYVSGTSIVGDSHTFTVTNSQTYPDIFAFAFSGVIPTLSTHNNNGVSSGTSMSSGSTTPGDNGALVITGCRASTAGGPATNPIEISDFTQWLGSAEGVTGWKVQSTAAAVAGSFTWTNSSQASAAIVSFLPSSPHVPGPNIATVHGNGTTAAIDTTGANLLIASITCLFTNASITDSKSNTWTPLTQRIGSFVLHQQFYCLSPTVGSGHTFTVTAGSFPSIVVHAFSGINAFDSQNGAGAGSAISLAVGSVTPTADGALIITSLGLDSPSQTPHVTPSMTEINHPFTGGLNVAVATGWYVQATAVAVNPTWSWPSGSPNAGSVAVFRLSSVVSIEKSYAFIDQIIGTGT